MLPVMDYDDLHSPFNYNFIIGVLEAMVEKPDPVLAFFKSLPPPESDFAGSQPKGTIEQRDRISARVEGTDAEGTAIEDTTYDHDKVHAGIFGRIEDCDKMRLVAMTYLSSSKCKSADPDHKFLYNHMHACLDMKRGFFGAVLMSLARLALLRRIPTEDPSLKAQHLRYAAWLARGRKDEDNPFASSRSSVARDHSLLPSSSESLPCASCGKTGIKMTTCGSCIVRTEGTVTFGTHYCGKVCQEAHWKDHRDYCKALRQLHRSMSMFDQVYSLVLELATDPCSQPIKMCKKAGLIIVQSPTKEMERAFGYQGKHVIRGVPDASALSRELKIAAMMRHHCLDIMEGGMALLEYFLGCK